MRPSPSDGWVCYLGEAVDIAPGVAEDQATIAGTGTVTLPDGTVAETITVLDFNPARWERSAKVYARNVGLVQDAKLNLIR